MTNFKESLSAFINPILISKAAESLGEKETDIINASSSIISGFMGITLKKNRSLHIKNILKEAGNLDLWRDVDKIYEGHPTKEQQQIGDDFLQHLFGDKAADFTDPIAANAGISNIAANKLISILAPLFAGFLGKKLVQEDTKTTALFEEIEAEKTHFMGLIPLQIIKSFNLNHDTHHTAANHPGSDEQAMGTKELIPDDKETARDTANNSCCQGRCSYCWLKWLIPLLLVVFAFFCWKSCEKEPTSTVESIQEEVVVIDAISN